MRATLAAVASALLAASCGPVEDGSGTTTALLGLEVIDAPPALTASGGDYLFGVRYRVPPDARDTPTYYVSDLRVDIVARHVQYASVWSLTYGLYYDHDADGRFGPGDVLYVRERSRSLFGPTDAGIYQVRLMSGSHLLGTAEWAAK